MDFTVEKKESENNAENAHPTTLDSSSQLASALDSNNKEIEERQARELKAGLHPLKVPLSLSLSHTHTHFYFHFITTQSLKHYQQLLVLLLE